MTLSGHQRCPMCNKVFINTTYLQSHIIRRHNHISEEPSTQSFSTVTQDLQQKQMATELEQVRQRLLAAEQQLLEERRGVAALEANAPPRYIKEEMESEVSDPPLPPLSTASTEPAAVPGPSSAPDGIPVSSPPQDSALAAQVARQAEEISRLREELERQRRAVGTAGPVGAGASARVSLSRGAMASGASLDTPTVTMTTGGGAIGTVANMAAVGMATGGGAVGTAADMATMTVATGGGTIGTAANMTPVTMTAGGGAIGTGCSRSEQTGGGFVALEGRLEAQERYWQCKLRTMRQKHDTEVANMKRLLKERHAAHSRGSSQYVNVHGGEGSPRVAQYLHCHQSPPPGTDPSPRPPAVPCSYPAAKPRPCIAPPERRSRSLSCPRRLTFADDDLAEEGKDCDDREARRRCQQAAFDSTSSDRVSRGRSPSVGRSRHELEAELNDRLMRLGIEPGTDRLTDDLMADKLRHVQANRLNTQGYGDIRRQVDEDVNQRLAKFYPAPTRRRSKIGSFAKGVLQRGVEMSRSLISLGNKGRVPHSPTIDAHLVQRALAAQPGRRAASLSPAVARYQHPPSPPRWRDRARRCDDGDDDDDFDDKLRDGGHVSRGRFKFGAKASKHILERFTRCGVSQSSLIKSTTIHRVVSADSADWRTDDTAEDGGRYEQLLSRSPPTAHTDRRPPVVSGSGTGLLPPSSPVQGGFITTGSQPGSRTSGGSGSRTSVTRTSSAAQASDRASPSVSRASALSSVEVGTVSLQHVEPSRVITSPDRGARLSGSANTLSTSQWVPSTAADPGSTSAAGHQSDSEAISSDAPDLDDI